MKKIHVLVGLALAGAFGAAQAVTADFSGYFRAGNALNTRGGMGTCFGLGSLQGQDGPKWRLGNECDYVIEPNFNATLVKSKDGSEWHVHFMPSSGRGWDSPDAWNGNKDVGVNFGQVYGYGQNIAMLGKGTLWAGRRFYNRLQLGINDHFLERDDGDGVGLDDINLGGAKLSLGFMNGNGSQDQYKSTNVKYIAKIGDIQTGGGSNLAIHLKVEKQSKTDDHSTTPAKPTAKQPGFTSIGAYENIPLGSAGNILAGLRLKSYDKESGLKSAWLVPIQYGANFGGINFDAILEVEGVKFTGDSGKGTGSRNMLGFRFEGPILDNLNWNFEAGTINLKTDKDAKKQTMNKATAALVFHPAENAVPRVKFYYTYAKWNKNAANPNPTVWGDKTAGSVIGAQAEAWF
jgi:maltoporin